MYLIRSVVFTQLLPKISIKWVISFFLECMENNQPSRDYANKAIFKTNNSLPSDSNPAIHALFHVPGHPLILISTASRRHLHSPNTITITTEGNIYQILKQNLYSLLKMWRKTGDIYPNYYRGKLN